MHLGFACGSNGSVVRALESGMRATAQWALTKDVLGTSKETNVLTTLFGPRVTRKRADSWLEVCIQKRSEGARFQGANSACNTNNWTQGKVASN